jgi:acetoin utilization deacetylase AcuC-like enzyme
MLTVFHHPNFAADIGQHIMPMRKFQLVADAIRGKSDIRIVAPDPVTEGDLLRVHTREYVAAVKTGEPRELAESQKFPWSKQLYPSVLLTNGGVLAAARCALREGVSAALCSGFHHSHSTRGEGFCTLNGLIISIEALRASGEIQTAAILDMDLHYGNGTAILARSRPHVFALSIYGNDYWDNQAYRDVTLRHHEDGENHQSAALPENCDRKTMLAIMEANLPKLLSHGKPDLLLYQAGADPYFEDPYSPLKLDHDDLLVRDERVFRFARESNLKIAWVLAGGYTQDVAQVVKVHTNTFQAWRRVFG